MFLEFRDNNTLHNDLIFNFDGQIIECDSYYFALDRLIEPEKEDSNKIKKVLTKLLEQWQLYVSRSKSGEIIFLPFDFSDEYTGCLKCEFQNSEVCTTVGYLGFEGWILFPSDISKFVKSSLYFIKSKDKVLNFGKSEFIRQIKENIKAIQ